MNTDQKQNLSGGGRGRLPAHRHPSPTKWLALLCGFVALGRRRDTACYRNHPTRSHESQQTCIPSRCSEAPRRPSGLALARGDRPGAVVVSRFHSQVTPNKFPSGSLPSAQSGDGSPTRKFAVSPSATGLPSTPFPLRGGRLGLTPALVTAGVLLALMTLITPPLCAEVVVTRITPTQGGIGVGGLGAEDFGTVSDIGPYKQASITNAPPDYAINTGGPTIVGWTLTTMHTGGAHPTFYVYIGSYFDDPVAAAELWFHISINGEWHAYRMGNLEGDNVMRWHAQPAGAMADITDWNQQIDQWYFNVRVGGGYFIDEHGILNGRSIAYTITFGDMTAQWAPFENDGGTTGGGTTGGGTTGGTPYEPVDPYDLPGDSEEFPPSNITPVLNMSCMASLQAAWTTKFQISPPSLSGSIPQWTVAVPIYGDSIDVTINLNVATWGTYWGVPMTTYIGWLRTLIGCVFAWQVFRGWRNIVTKASR